MAAQLSRLDPEEYVVELGPGTGAVTGALLAAGVAPHRLIVIERDGAFMEKLKADFPGALLLRASCKNSTDSKFDMCSRQLNDVFITITSNLRSG